MQLFLMSFSSRENYAIFIDTDLLLAPTSVLVDGYGGTHGAGSVRAQITYRAKLYRGKAGENFCKNRNQWMPQPK